MAVGRWRDLASESAERMDLGEVVVMPGLVNAHCHLDYTGMAGCFPPQRSFPDWIKLIKETKLGWSRSDYFQSWVRGARMLIRNGTTTVADIEAVPQLLPRVWNATPLNVISFLEVIGFSPSCKPASVLRDALRTASRCKAHRPHLGLSPHAPYTTTPELLRLAGKVAASKGWRISIHAAESAPEYDMFLHGSGDLHDWIRHSGRSMNDCGTCSPVRHVINSGLHGENTIVVHANYLGPGDAAELAARRMHVAHCPRSHHYFQHRPFPLRSLLRAGVNVALGTDSLASVCISHGQTIELDMFAEMRTLQAAQPWLRPRGLVRMATMNGARALGLAERIGRLSPGCRADLICIPFAEERSQALEAVIAHKGPVKSSMVNGVWVKLQGRIRRP